MTWFAREKFCTPASPTPRPAWSPLASGVLTGKYHGHGSAEQGRLTSEMMKELQPNSQRNELIVAAVKKVADATGRAMAQIALAWLRYRPVPVIPIIGARKLIQLRDNLASLDLELSPDQVTMLDEASRIELGFPHDFYSREIVRSILYGGLADRIVTEPTSQTGRRSATSAGNSPA